MTVWKRCGLVISMVALSTSASAVDLESEESKISYMIGMDIGQTLQRQGKDLDLDALVAAIKASYEGGELAMSAEEAAAVRQAYISQMQEAQASQQAASAEVNLAAGAEFLAANAQQDGVMTTASGLQYQVVTQGDGSMPAATDTVTVHYRGTLLDGTEFDSSFARNEPISFALNRVIPGWTEGLQLMPVGSKYLFWIKPELGYGAAGGGPIPPNSTLKFEVELLGIQ